MSNKIRLAVAGVGNCCSSLIQGIEFYKKNGYKSLGIIHDSFGGYRPSDIEITVAFDIAEKKVGKDVSEAIFSDPNNTPKIIDVPKLGVDIKMGQIHDGIAESIKEIVKVSSIQPVDVAKVLRDNEIDVLLNLVPSGASKATEYYAKQALKAKCGFINAGPFPLASNPDWAKSFKDTGIPIVGDDIMNQIGSTIIHKNLLKMLVDRGIIIKETYCLDVGGAMESLNSVERSRWVKRSFKSEAVRSQIPELQEVPVVSGSTDFVDFLENRRESYFWILGNYFHNSPITIDIRLTTIDAPNSFAIVIDAIRGVKIALDRKTAGPIESVSAFCCKKPPTNTTIQEAEIMVNDFISGKRND
ncbi:MAG: inositol-3-phosphate synthase [Candidatus Lokiarchaeota archaeon]|nr:inositol-3-phosphate synthase [Candidatus Lokiarchaeota archaeon]